MKKIELLSPAGTMESLKAAIHAGCDAVYLAGKFFGARSYAGNFDNDELKEAVTYAHLYGIKVYVTVNTIVYEREVKAFLKYIDFLVSIHVDALIIQDLGMMDFIRKIYPDLELHASTQMNVHNLEGVQFLEKIGVKRVVLARETNIETIKKIKKNTNIELEVFGHGALCISYSGNCYMSYFIGGRSGNRGTCAQCCRQDYDLLDNNKIINKNKYILSTKDLNTLYHISEFIESGIDSLKIEGRMKRPEYVYLVTSIYRKAIDSYYNHQKFSPLEETKKLQKLFSRDFTKGFLFNEENKDFISSFRPNHKGTYLGKVIKVNKNSFDIKLEDDLSIKDGIRIIQNEDVGFTITKMVKKENKVQKAYKGDIVTLYSKEQVTKDAKVYKTTDSIQIEEMKEKINQKKRISISGKIILKRNEKVMLEISDGKRVIQLQSNKKVELSKNHPLTKDIVYDKINSLGNTIYEFKELKIEMDDQIFFSLSDLKELRRKGIDLLNQKRLERKNVEKQDYFIDIKNYPQGKNYNLYLSTVKHNLDKKFNTIYVENDIYNIIKDQRKVKRLPRIMDEYRKEDKVLVSELGSLLKYKHCYTDFDLNVTNSYTVAFLHSLGVDRITLSYELKSKDVEDIINAYHERYHKHPNVEVIVQGKIEAMITKYDFFEDYNVKDKIYLKDKYQNKFEIKKEKNYNIIYHYKRINDQTDYFNLGVNNIRIEEEI